MKTKAPRTAAAGGDVYFDLVQQHPLKPIRNAADHAAAMVMARRLMLVPESRKRDRPAGEADYLGTLTTLIDAYERKAFPTPRGEPHERLRHIVVESETSQVQLAKIIGMKQPAVSLILAGKRGLSGDAVKRLAAHFKLGVGYFI